MKNKRNLLYIYGLIPAVIWGVSFIATKQAVSEVPPSTLGFIRFIIAYAVLEIVTLIKRESFQTKIPSRERWVLFLMGFFGVTLYFVGENYGLQHTSSSNGSLIVSTIPIFTLIAERIVYRRRPSLITTIGLIMSFVGIYFLIFGFSFIKDVNVRGDLVMFVPVFSWVVFTYISKKKQTSLSTLIVTKEMTFYGAVSFFPFMFFELKSGLCFFRLSVLTWISIIYLAVICSSFAYVLWNKGLKEYDEKKVNSFIYTIPVFTIIAELIISRSLPKLSMVLSSILIIAGLFITHREAK
ncbi:MAG: DMT family transporter [bacterium]|nr:DMT family transporter [bacterium]